MATIFSFDIHRPVKIHKWCQKWALVLYRFPGLFSLELNVQYGRWWASWILMFGLVKIQEMIPGNKHILLKTSFSCEIQQVIWVIRLKPEKNGIGRWWPSWILIFKLIKIQKWCQKWALYATFSMKSDVTRVSMTIYFKVTFSIWLQAVIWILMVGLVKIQKRCPKSIPHAKISWKSGITQLSISICFQVTFPIWPPAAILDFGFSQIPPPFSRRSWGLIFF